MGYRRVLQIVFGSIFGLLAAALLVVTAVRWEHVGPNGLLGAALMLVPGILAILVFELQLRAIKAQTAEVRAEMETIAAKLFDAPAKLRDGYDLTVTAGASGEMIAGFERGEGFTADGTVGDVKVSAASHVSTLGRQFGEASHIYSHVVVDVLGLTTQFHLGKEGIGSKLARAAGQAHDSTVGDAEFDDMWSVDVEEDLAREVLDDDIRARLTTLRGKVGQVSQDLGVGTMSVLLTGHGLALRWPGPLEPELAVFVRDLLIDMRKRLLAHVDRKAARAVSNALYRVADEAPSVPRSDELEALNEALNEANQADQSSSGAPLGVDRKL